MNTFVYKTATVLPSKRLKDKPGAARALPYVYGMWSRRSLAVQYTEFHNKLV